MRSRPTSSGEPSTMDEKQPSQSIRDLQHNVREASAHLANIQGHSTDLVYETRKLLEGSRRLMLEADKVLARR
jgi:hypothetical protein